MVKSVFFFGGGLSPRFMTLTPTEYFATDGTIGNRCKGNQGFQVRVAVLTITFTLAAVGRQQQVYCAWQGLCVCNTRFLAL